MQRKRTLMIAALTVSAALAGFVVAGPAFGANWQEYDGSPSAGSAFLIPVPEGADALSFVMTPRANATAPAAELTLLDPEDNRVGNFRLDGGRDAVDVLDPVAGKYVVFVYTLADADIGVRLLASAADDLTLVRADVDRVDRPIVRGHEGALDREVVFALENEPVFATLLYQGRAENLDAFVTSERGPVLDIRGESGTSYAPGLSVGASGARTTDLMNLAAGQITVDVRADHFDGTLYFTTLHVDRAVEDLPVDDPELPEVPETPVEAIPHAPLGAGVPTAVAVSDGALVIGLVDVFEAREASDNDTASDAEWWQQHEHGAERGRAADVHVYDPLDAFVGTFTLTRAEPVVVLEDLEVGEHVLLVESRGASRGDFVAAVATVDALAEPKVRGLELVRGSVERPGYSAPFGFEDTFNVTFDTPPLDLVVDLTRSTVAVDFRAVAVSPEGEAYRLESSLTALGGLQMNHHGAMDRAMLVAGDYDVTFEATSFDGDVVLRWVTYDRGAEPIAVEELEEPSEPEEPEEPADPDAAPSMGVGSVVDRVRGVLGL